MRRLLLSALLCLFASITVRSDPFVILPNGELAFNTSFTTQGVFTCALCSGSGTNSVVLGSGTNTLTLTFTGVNTTILVGGAAVPTSVGQIETVATGAGFIFPSESNPNVPLLRFNLGVAQSSPTAGTTSFLFRSGPGGGTSLLFTHPVTDYIAFPTGPNPPGFSYTFIVYSFSEFTIPNTNAALNINASLSAIPEPTSLLLFGSGLGMVVTFLAKRFSKPEVTHH
jgi:PEP-CTERM motif